MATIPSGYHGGEMARHRTIRVGFLYALTIIVGMVVVLVSTRPESTWLRVVPVYRITEATLTPDQATTVKWMQQTGVIRVRERRDGYLRTIVRGEIIMPSAFQVLDTARFAPLATISSPVGSGVVNDGLAFWAGALPLAILCVLVFSHLTSIAFDTERLQADLTLVR